MFLSNRRKDPKALMVIGMSCLVIGTLWSNAPIFSRHFTPNWNDALKGFFYGLSIALNLCSVRLAVRQRKEQNSCRPA
jgi:hypothetical protein